MNLKTIINKKYLIVGILNTITGYLIGVFTYKSLEVSIGVVGVGFLTNFINITLSFIMYKIFVFKTNKRWVSEYIKCYIAYGSIAILGIFQLWLYVEIIRLNIEISQGIIVLSSVVISYFSNLLYTFKN